MMPLLSKEQVMKALAGVLDPKMVNDVAIDKGHVVFAINVGDTSENLEPLRQKAEAAVAALAPGMKVTAVLTAERNAPPAGGKKEFSHKISSRPVAPQVKHIIAVASGKGGVGKSTVAANLAAALAKLGKKTGLLDADIYGSSQPRMMGLHQKPETNADDMIVPPQAHGMKVMSMGFFVEPERPVIWRGPMVHSAIQQLLRDVAWGELDILVIDLPPGTGDAQLSLAQYVPLSGAVIVSTPQEVALSEAVKAVRMFEKTNVPVLGMVENMSFHECTACGHHDHIFGHGGARKAAERLEIPFLAEIPLQSAVREKADAGTPAVLAGGAFADIFMNLAARVYASLPEKKIRAAGA